MFSVFGFSFPRGWFAHWRLKLKLQSELRRNGNQFTAQPAHHDVCPQLSSSLKKKCSGAKKNWNCKQCWWEVDGGVRLRLGLSRFEKNSCQELSLTAQNSFLFHLRQCLLPAAPYRILAFCCFKPVLTFTCFRFKRGKEWAEKGAWFILFRNINWFLLCTFPFEHYI